ncbi:MAG: hypothetical protein HC840_26675 [Leptolyngbyaceae cyanobacterium RM2_2_4]|nr:hypothetical protein [Leptolyngbyaceae cyanobacterium SM1_4_3]NJN92464.1 hypothetical protein [Leptolyngbyaceae cyanobacterium SL_5_14]NJO52387.1 hypothetical protein [Leptolyngbyaceae cyanobacterium RM2_2_4]NJO67202.1 hypothetical protein [Leptolyngbyaceae cyanobacterium RM1_405_57]
MKVKGIKQGQAIELLEDIDIPDGVEITVEIEIDTNKTSSSTGSISEQEKLEKLNRLFGAWSNQPNLDEIFAEIDQERHIDMGREIESLNS